MSGQYVEIGGLRHGQKYWPSINTSWPLGKLEASSEHLRLSVRLWKWEFRAFEFERSEIISLRKRQGPLRVGVAFEHTKEEYPPYILFWTLRYGTLKAALERLGYPTIEDDK